MNLQRITSKDHRYIPEVDGLRFIAIVIVVIHHVLLSIHRGGGYSDATKAEWWWLIYKGDVGVELFFAISGFILALPFAKMYLLREKKVSIKRYFMRRLTRLEPPFIICTTVFYLLAWASGAVFSKEPGFVTDYFLQLIYSYQFFNATPPAVNGVTWSLEVEVQFYILAPLVFIIFRRRPEVRILFYAAVMCFFSYLHAEKTFSYNLLAFFQYFTVGIAIADLYLNRCIDDKGSHWFDLMFWLSMVMTIFTNDEFVIRMLLPWYVFFLFLGGLYGKSIRPVLRLTPLTVIGGMCYTIYLLHMPYIKVCREVIMPMFAGNLALTLVMFVILSLGFCVVAVAFYMLIERPCMDPKWPQKLSAWLKSFWSKPDPAGEHPAG